MFRRVPLTAALTLLLAAPAVAQNQGQNPQQPGQQPGAQQPRAQQPAAAQPGGQPAGGQAENRSYLIGHSLGAQLAQQTFRASDFSPQSLLQGLMDGLAGQEPRLSEAEQQSADAELRTMIRARLQERQAAQAAAGEENMRQSQQFLAEVAQREGVQKLPSGLLYEVIEEGTGASPTAESTVRVHYTGTLPDGTVFDSSVQRGEPATFEVGGVIPGWTEALQRMKVGGKWRLYIPPNLAYGLRGAPPRIGPNQALVFEVELLDILN